MSAAVEVVEWGGERARVGPWRGDPHIAQLTPASGTGGLSPELVRRCLDTVRRLGFTEVLTGALAPAEQRAYLQGGFRQHALLHLLSRDVQALPPPSAAEAFLRTARRRDHGAVLAIDQAAFPPFWRLDAGSLEEARTATPSSRFRVAAGPGVVGYLVCGRAGRHGYLQRLAVAPGRQRQGLGRALVLDGLRWMHRRGVTRALVNTQLDNEAGLQLYRSLGFRLEPDVLAVLRRPVEALGAPLPARRR